MEKHLDLWIEKYGNKEFAFDFANNLILKNEFKTNKPYSWDLDFFDYNDQKQFIASELLIKKRNKKPIFEFNNQKYFVTKNPDNTYSIINLNQITNLDNPLDYDLFLINKINTYNEKTNSFWLSIVYSKMNESANEIFIDYINNVVASLFNTKYFQLEENELKNHLKWEINIENLEWKEFIKLLLLLKSIMSLSVFRLKEKYQQLWTFNHDELFFNFVISNNKKTNQKLISFLSAFENKIFFNEEIIKKMIENKIESNNFIKCYDMNETNIYTYKFANLKFDSYLWNITSNKNKKR